MNRTELDKETHRMARHTHYDVIIIGTGARSQGFGA